VTKATQSAAFTIAPDTLFFYGLCFSLDHDKAKAHHSNFNNEIII
jgi:hypothetical protein